MSGEKREENSGGLINLQDPYLSSIVMDLKTAKNSAPTRSRGRRMFRYFTLESLFLLVCLTASLLILPLILPPLPPPPLMLLLLPICILAVLMVLAFMPANARDAASQSHTYA